MSHMLVNIFPEMTRLAKTSQNLIPAIHFVVLRRPNVGGREHNLAPGAWMRLTVFSAAILAPAFCAFKPNAVANLAPIFWVSIKIHRHPRALS